MCDSAWSEKLIALNASLRSPVPWKQSHSPWTGGGGKGVDRRRGGSRTAVKYKLEVRKLGIMGDACVRCPLTGGCCASQSAGRHWSQQERMRHWGMSPQLCSLTALSRKGGTIPKRLQPKYKHNALPALPASVRACTRPRVCLLLKLLPFGRPKQCLNLLQQLRFQGQTGTILLKFTLGNFELPGLPYRAKVS